MSQVAHSLHHIAVVVPDVEAALAFWRDTLGLPVARVERIEAEAVDIAFLPLGETGELELIAPIVGETESGVARFLAKRGAGLHHLCLNVGDLDAMAARLAERGIELITETPRVGADGRRYLFIHPRSTGGVLLELYEAVPDEPAR